MRIALPFAASLFAVCGVVAAEEYQFIVSGDPVAAATENCSSMSSQGTGMATGALSVPSVASALESRYRTWFCSESVDLDSSELHIGLRFILK